MRVEAHRSRHARPLAARSPGGLLWLLALAAATAPAADGIDILTDTPAATIASLQGGLVTIAQLENLTIEERFAQLLPVVTGTHDLAYIATLAVRRQWDGFDPEQQARYLAAFETLSVMTYASRFGGVDGESFVAATVRAETAESADIGSGVRNADGEIISLDYVLHPTERGWRIVNIVADGVSDLALKRAEYRRILSEQSPDALIAELERQTANLRSP